MRTVILIIYKNGTSVCIDVPENYYRDKYSKKSDKKIHKIFIKEYCRFVKALNKKENLNTIYVGDYIGFSTATISVKDILSVDIKKVSEDSIFVNYCNDDVNNEVNIPEVLGSRLHLDISEDQIEKLIGHIAKQNLLQHIEMSVKNILEDCINAIYLKNAKKQPPKKK